MVLAIRKVEWLLSVTLFVLGEGDKLRAVASVAIVLVSLGFLKLTWPRGIHGAS